MRREIKVSAYDVNRIVEKARLLYHSTLKDTYEFIFNNKVYVRIWKSPLDSNLIYVDFPEVPAEVRRSLEIKVNGEWKSRKIYPQVKRELTELAHDLLKKEIISPSSLVIIEEEEGISL